MPFFRSVPCCFHRCHFVVGFEIRKCEISNFVLIFQDCFSYSGSRGILDEFYDEFFYLRKNELGIFAQWFVKKVLPLGSEGGRTRHGCGLC